MTMAFVVMAVVDAVDVLHRLDAAALLVVVVIDAVEDDRNLRVETGTGADLAEFVLTRCRC
jgi:hypothetical protein